MRDNPFHNTKKRGKMTVKPLHGIHCRKSNRTGWKKVFSGFIRPAMKRKERSTNRCRRRSSCQQNNRIKTVRLKNTHIHTQRQEHWVHRSDDKLCWYFSPRLSRSAVRRCGRRGGSFSVYFFFYPVDPVTGARASYCVWAVRGPRPKRALSLHLSWNGHGQFTWRHTPRNKLSALAWAWPARSLNARSLFMRHTHPRARLRGELGVFESGTSILTFPDMSVLHFHIRELYILQHHRTNRNYSICKCIIFEVLFSQLRENLLIYIWGELWLNDKLVQGSIAVAVCL